MSLYKEAEYGINATAEIFFWSSTFNFFAEVLKPETLYRMQNIEPTKKGNPYSKED